MNIINYLGKKMIINEDECLINIIDKNKKWFKFDLSRINLFPYSLLL